LMLRAPHISTIHHYTTLFRSHRRPDKPIPVDVTGRVLRTLFDEHPGLPSPSDVSCRAVGRKRSANYGAGDVRLLRGLRSGFADPDRKSTRLNSSHQIISYAVF